MNFTRNCATRLLVLVSWIILSPVARAQSPASGLPNQATNPFEKTVRVADGIYVYDRKDFLAYIGAAPSPRNLDERNGVIERKRIGTVVASSGVRLVLELVTEPLGTKYEFREPLSGALVQELLYPGVSSARLLFTGKGVMYTHATTPPLCWGAATRKYELLQGKFVETRQALLLVNAETDVLREIKLTATLSDAAPAVASLREGSKAVVLTYESPDRFLIRTPLGLTGWLHGEAAKASLSIAQCN